MIMNINSNINKMNLGKDYYEFLLINKLYAKKKRNVKRKNVQTGKGASVIAYKI